MANYTIPQVISLVVRCIERNGTDGSISLLSFEDWSDLDTPMLLFTVADGTGSPYWIIADLPVTPEFKLRYRILHPLIGASEFPNIKPYVGGNDLDALLQLTWDDWAGISPDSADG